jgi:hypothetical protein
VEADIAGIFTETLTADIQVVFANQTSTVSTDTAKNMMEWDKPHVFFFFFFFIQQDNTLPLAGAFTVLLGVRVPDVSVGHFRY